MRRRIGVYGGTFDPVHNGHLRVAHAVLENFVLDELLFVPAFVPPHKRGLEISAPCHRYAMLALATMNEARMRIATLELEAPARPYTVETMAHLQAQAPDAALFFVMGMDSFRDVTMWRAHETLLTAYDIIVAARPGYRVNGLENENIAGHLASALQARVVDLRGGLSPKPEHFSAPHIFVTDYVAVDVSATTIRVAVEAGNDIAAYVPEAVADYIGKYGLYKATEKE
jgi:nicotinate-nucleotide adenylyltransferase